MERNDTLLRLLRWLVQATRKGRLRWRKDFTRVDTTYILASGGLLEKLSVVVFFASDPWKRWMCRVTYGCWEASVESSPEQATLNELISAIEDRLAAERLASADADHVALVRWLGLVEEEVIPREEIEAQVVPKGDANSQTTDPTLIQCPHCKQFIGFVPAEEPA